MKKSVCVTGVCIVLELSLGIYSSQKINTVYGPFTRYTKFRVVHAPEMSGTFSPPPWVSDPDMHHGTCEAHVPWCLPGLQTIGFLWSRWRGKRSWHSRRMRNPQFYVYGKRPMRLPQCQESSPWGTHKRSTTKQTNILRKHFGIYWIL